jgi:orotate phosphoribosyltransferase
VRGDLCSLVATRSGHFRLESGHHADTWLELDQLFRRPAALRPFIAELAGKLRPHRIDSVCGPLTGGALLAQSIAEELGVEFAFAERLVTDRPGLYPVDYRVASSLREEIRGRRVAVVDDAISAGSAVGATLADLASCGATPVVLGALLIGPRATRLATETQLPIESLMELPNQIWTPAECRICSQGVPLTSP